MSTNTLHRILAMPMRWASHWSGAASRRARAIRQPRILMYHIIGDDDISARQFEWQLRFLRRHFEPVGLGELVDRMQAGSTTGREVAITFDDGVRNHYLVAWPLLQTYEVPATFFVCPGLVESGDWIWRTELRMRLKLLDEATRAAIARDAGCPERAVEAIMEWTKALPMDDRLAFQQNVEKRTPDFSSSRQQIECHAPLTWEHMRSMDARLVTLGSHSRSHPILSTLTGPTLEDEIAGSRRDLEARLDRRVDLFSYPNGANSSEVVSLVRRHYRAAVTTRKNMVAAAEDLLLLPRIPATDSRAAFTRRMHRPTA